MRLKSIELSGFKSFAKKTAIEFETPITAVVGPNGSGKSNVAESFRFVLGEQSMKSMRGRRGEDMIWNGSSAVPRAGRASVKLLFDNADRVLNLDFDEVSIERVVYRDGGNDYLLNGSQVRLRDIAELLSQANIGASGHHIISQGEADRVLSSSVRERRGMLEDALGLTAYLYKREEAEKKLDKTGENMREVESLRREISPHLKFLSRQVQKIDEGRALREALFEQYEEYLRREHQYLLLARADISGKAELLERRASLNARIEELRGELGKKHDAGSDELMALEQKGREVAARREAAARELGSIEGELRAHARLAGEGTLPLAEAREFGEQVVLLAEGSRIAELVEFARAFVRRLRERVHISDTAVLDEKKQQLTGELASLKEREAATAGEVAALRHTIESEKDASRDAERELFAVMAERTETESALQALMAREEALRADEERFKEELREAAALLSRVPEYESGGTEFVDEPRAAQEERRRKLERQKIKLKEAGLGNASEILKEHKETLERDEFLARELADLEQSAAALRSLIAELTATLQTRFSGGVDKINAEFDRFFKLMFGGGSAALQVVKDVRPRHDDEEDVEADEGVDISINLPHKRVKGLHMLSGGERALTSIALIFAMSQVNPPPFLILDETDAALDEANARRYGDMLETLSRHSQLIVITHNRETMSRAGVLYGITMGADGASKLLSVKFEEAVSVAK